MAEIKNFGTFQEFLRANKGQILGDYFSHYHFLQTLKRLNNREIGILESYNILGDNDSSIMCIWTEGTYFVYGKKFNQVIINKAVEKIQLQKFKNFEFLGQRQLIEGIFKEANSNIDSRKNRIVYSCKKVLPILSDIEGVVESASTVYIDQLITNGIQYYKDEFKGQGNKTDNEVAENIVSSVESGRMYSIRTNNLIHSVVTIINYEHDKPMIGSLYTRPDSRNKGFAYKLLHTITSGLLGKGYTECGLLSNADNPASNKIFRKIGYEPIYELVHAYKQNKE